MSAPRGAWKLLRGALRAVVLFVAGMVVFIEEAGWRPLGRWMARLARWPAVAAFEARIRRVSPLGALGLFVVPAVSLFPLKLLAVWLIHLGHVPLGISVIVLAKLIGTALAGRLFVLTEPQLMGFSWFARAVGWWRGTWARVNRWMFDSVPGRAVRRLRAWLRAWTRRRFAARRRAR